MSNEDTTLHSNEEFTLKLNSQYGYIYRLFNKVPESEEQVQDMLNKGYDAFAKYKCTKWISNNKNLRPSSKELGEWVNKTWLPKMLSAGLKKWAVVKPDTSEGQMTMLKFIREFKEKGVEVTYFKTYEDAVEWMKD